MEHIKIRHMLPWRQGNSVFISNDRNYVWAIVQEAFQNPDVIKTHRTKKVRRVCKKTFGFPVGIHGFSRALCFSVVVIYDIEDNQIITAFPSV